MRSVCAFGKRVCLQKCLTLIMVPLIIGIIFSVPILPQHPLTRTLVYDGDPIVIVSAATNSLGTFIFAARDMSLVPSKIGTDVDIKVTGSVSPASVPSGDNATYTFTISNEGSSVARDVVMVQDLHQTTTLISARQTVGLCHIGDGEPITHITTQHSSNKISSIYCNVGDLQPGNSANVAIVVKTMVFGDGIETDPVVIRSTVVVSANEPDINPVDNRASVTFNSIPSPNIPPKVGIGNPVEDAVFVTYAENPVSIPVAINASDKDGSIAEVKVYNSGLFIGDANPQGEGTYSFDFTTAETGYHSLTASAKDNLGRITTSSRVQFLVNSPHTISIVKPTQQLISPGSSVEIETSSNLAGGRIQKIELFNKGILVGKMGAAGNTGNIYSHRFTINDIPRGSHSFTAILTDLTGAITISQPLNFKVTIPPTISITSPQDSATFASGSPVDITVQTGDADGYVKELNFYASGKRIGSLSVNIVKGTSTFRWISPDDGVYSIVVTATDDTDETVSSTVVNIGVNRTLVANGQNRER